MHKVMYIRTRDRANSTSQAKNLTGIKAWVSLVCDVLDTFSKFSLFLKSWLPIVYFYVK